MSFNESLFRLIFGLSGRNAFADEIGVLLAQYLPYLLMLGFLIYALQQRGWRRRIFFFAEAMLAVILSRGIITEVIRFFYHNPRPFTALGITPLIGETSYSFPSGHAAWFFALALTMLYYNRKIGTWYMVAAVAIGLARIFVGVHWPFDILGGALAGIFSAWITHAALRHAHDSLFNPQPVAEEPQA